MSKPFELKYENKNKEQKLWFYPTCSYTLLSLATPCTSRFFGAKSIYPQVLYKLFLQREKILSQGILHFCYPFWTVRLFRIWCSIQLVHMYTTPKPTGAVRPCFPRIPF